MKIDYLRVEGFKSIAEAVLRDIEPFTAFAGANGAGKSNLVDALAFFGAVVKRGASQAIRDFGGFNQIHCFKHRKTKRTTARFKLRISLQGVQCVYSLAVANMHLAPEVTEHLAVDGLTLIEREVSTQPRILFPDSSTPSVLPNYSPDMTALMLQSHLELYQWLTNISVYRFDPLQAKRPNASTVDATLLSTDGSNVAALLSVMEKNAAHRDQILEWIELIVPGMKSVSTQKQRLDSTTVLTFEEQGTKTRFPAQLISDGTVYALCIMAALLSRSSKSGLTIIEEPERGVHPKAIGELVQLMRENASLEHPVLITTHSESIVRNLDLEELLLVSKPDGRTSIKRASMAGASTEDIPLDTAWLTNMLDGGLPW
ncbi:AAA family ATPase [Pseudomonas sp. KNUC1026]|uniref:AAA family ATPase n=1 Tax=Pseudomonas sp. KNUC1026 TaxID=2893890 RepID=UPI001F168ECE|nr:AAA family ATPase [Pseudomonas sp. KNUC1026]UFH50037.1 AAA family ATPase [Pseudomonas sp. KNUC1026]